MTAPDARNDAVQFLYKHGELTYGAAAAAIAKLCNNGFYITRAPLAEAHPLAAEARMALERDDVAGWIGSLPKAPLAEALAVPEVVALVRALKGARWRMKQYNYSAMQPELEEIDAALRAIDVKRGKA